MIFHQLYDAESSTYTYLLADETSKEAVIIDPVLDQVERDEKLINDYGLTLKYSLDTHVHADHITAADALRVKLGAKTCVSHRANLPCVDVPLKDGDSIRFGSHSIHVLETPGHTQCSLSFHIGARLFTGDTLLIRGCGRTDFQNGSAVDLYQSVHQKIFSLSDETQVYPGHDYKGQTSSTIGMEKRLNPRLKTDISQATFVSVMANLGLAAPKKLQEALPANLACGKKGASL